MCFPTATLLRSMMKHWAALPNRKR
jgi:hypothetical protein